MPRPNARGIGGVVVLSRPNLKKKFHLLHVTSASITFSIHSHKIHALYLPPYMPWQECQSHLPPIKCSVIIGDINCHPNIHASQLLTTRRQELIAVCLQHNLNWITDSNDFRHGHVLLDSSLSTEVSVHALISPKTDHQSLLFRLPPMPPKLSSTSQTIRYNLKHLDNPRLADQLIDMFEKLWADYGDLLHSISQKILQKNCNQDVAQDLTDTMYSIYTSLLNTCCEATLGTYKTQENQKKIDNSIPFLRSSMAHDHAVRLFKRSQRGKRQQLVSDDSDLSPMASATKFYETLYNPPNSDRFRSTLYSRQYHPPDSNPLLFMCTPTNIGKHINKYPSTKTFGLDVLHIRIFKTLSASSIFLSSMHLPFHTFLSSTFTPSAWNVSQITPIPKKSDSFTPSSSRPISLTPCLRRVFESYLLSFIYSQPALNEFSPYQAGFRPGYTTVTHLWLAHASAHLPSHSRNLHIFLDLEKAYDRVPIARLLDKLQRRGTPAALIQLVDSLFSSCSSQMIVNQNVGPLFSRSVGLFQGSILSPWLFNVYIDDLAEDLARIDPQSTIPPLLLFADDIKLQPSSVSTAKRMLAIVQTWSVFNGINVNVNKSAVIDHPSTRSLSLALNGAPLPLVSSYDYLGMPYTANGIDFTSFVATVTRRTQKLFFASTRNSRGWSPFIRLHIFKTLLRSTYEYALSLLFASKTSITPIQKFQNIMLQWICQGHRGHDMNHTLTGVSNVSSRLQELTLRFQAKFRSLHPDNPVHALKSACCLQPTL